MINRRNGRCIVVVNWFALSVWLQIVHTSCSQRIVIAALLFGHQGWSIQPFGCQGKVCRDGKVVLRRKDNLAAKLVADFSTELFRVGTMVDIRFAGLERTVRQKVEVSEWDSSWAKLPSAILPSIMGTTDSDTCFSFKALASACTNISYSSSVNSESKGRGCANRWLISFQLFGFAGTLRSGYL